MKYLNYEGLKYLYGKILARINTRVEKEDGKGLSSNDYSNEEKAAVAAADRQKHTHDNKAVLDTITQEMLNHTYTHPESGVTPGTYRSVTVDSKGHVTAGSNPTSLEGYGITDALRKNAVTWGDLLTDTASEG
ncbi:MAG: hypothetical protein Q4C73_09480 [Eubacteriales bacterium]|nr:hypothetical protein [Eubacteriales bacterium]